ncbi:MAG: hypothetical protein GY845_28605 [Planctomycetes bacterium]|nr:hypothetical protein [Planctomycetota bacterium]
MGNTEQENISPVGQSILNSSNEGLLLMALQYIGMTLHLGRINCISLTGDSNPGKLPIVTDYAEPHTFFPAQDMTATISSPLHLCVAYTSLSSHYPLSFWRFPDASISEEIKGSIIGWLFRR